MKLDKYLLAILAFMVLVVGSIFIISDMVGNYGLSDPSGEFDSVYTNMGEMYNLSKDVKDATLKADIEGADQSWDSMVKGGYSSVRLLKNSFKIVGDMIETLAIKLGVPAFFVMAALTALMIMVVFGIVYLIFRVN